MSRRKGTTGALAACAAVVGCASAPPPPAPPRPLPPHRTVEVEFARPALSPPAPPDEARPVAARAVLVIPPALEQFVYVHYDARWRQTFRIHLGTYVRDRLEQIAAQRFRRAMVVKALHEVPALPDDVSLILLPELGPIDYRTPWYSESGDASFQVRMRLRILYSTRRDAAILDAAGAALGPFGADGAGTQELAREALDRMLDELDRTLAETVSRL